MSEVTGIGWTNRTWNPWTGCRRVSPGCLHCYMFALLARFGRNALERLLAKDWRKPIRWNAEAAEKGVRFKVFPSLCDWLDDEVPIEWLARFLQLIYATPNLDWLLLTKRLENFEERVEAAFEHTHGETWQSLWLQDDPPENVWIGTSVEDQQRADERIPELLKIPARVRFLSVEPLLEKVDLQMALEDFKTLAPDLSRNPAPVDWVIVGGESGPGRRDCGVMAIADVAQQCTDAGVPCFVKQDCALKPGQQGRIAPEVWALKQFPS